MKRNSLGNATIHTKKGPPSKHSAQGPGPEKAKGGWGGFFWINEREGQNQGSGTLRYRVQCMNIPVQWLTNEIELQWSTNKIITIKICI